MSRARVFALSAFVLFAVAALAGWALMSSLPGGEGLHLSIDGETLDVEGLTGFWPVDLLVGLLGFAIATFVVLVVVPLALLVGVGTPLLVLAALAVLGMLALGVVAVLLLSPLLLFGALIWWIARPRRVAPSTTIPA